MSVATLRLLAVAPMLALSIVASTPPAAAQPEASMRVSFADLDLSKPQDVVRLDRRLDHAAETLCGSQTQLDFLERNACWRDVRSRAVQALDAERRRRVLAASAAGRPGAR